MPISPITLQRRHAELGRIRLGNKGDRGQPQKLERFRFTSPRETYIADLAALYGGKPRPWNNNGKPEFEVFTDAATIPVVVVKGGLSQWMETWSGGGCVHRCDGETGHDGTPCDPKDRQHQAAKPTTRVSVMLPELDALGVWRLETHGWNAAAEIPAVAELAQHVGDLVPAELHLVERRAIKDGKTSRFVVPILDLKIGIGRLREVVAAASATPLELDGPGQQTPALGAGTGGQQQPAAEPERQGPAPVNVTPDDIAAATDATVLLQMWDDVAGHPYQDKIRAAIEARVAEVRGAAGQQPDADGIVDAELVDEATDGPNADAAAQALADQTWQRVLAAAGKIGMTTPDLEVDFEQAMGKTSADATAAEMDTYLGKLGVTA